MCSIRVYVYMNMYMTDYSAVFIAGNKVIGIILM